MEKYIKYLCGLCLLCVLCASCQDGDWDAPDFSGGAPYGNNQLSEDNVITIAQLKAMFPNYNTQFSNFEITTDAKLRVRVTGNDVQGNLYNEIAVQEDASGDALLISISGSDLFAFMPVGQELIVDLKGLYFGCNASQPQIGIPYTNDKGNTFPSRMPSYLWQQHVRLVGKAEPEKVVATDFPANPTFADAGKLMTIKNVTIQGANGVITWADSNDPDKAGNGVKKFFTGMSKDFMTYTSTYADFANTPIPTGRMNITGIWKVYQNNAKYDPQWEVIIRDIRDIEVIGE